MQFPVTARGAYSRDSQLGRLRVSVIQLAPVAALVGCAAGLAWQAHGSIVAGSWLPYSIGIVLIAATVLLAGVAARPSRLLLAGLAGLLGLALWDALSLLWAPSPSLARDEALLVLTYVVALAVAAVTLWTDGRRLGAVGCVAALSGGSAVAAAAALLWGTDPVSDYYGGRLAFPISYVNATGALLAVGIWPALLVAARREAPTVGRALALGAATAAFAGTLMTQSKGAVLGLIVSTLFVLAFAPMRLRLVPPLALAAVLPIALFSRLTEPFRVDGPEAIRHAAAAALTLATIGLFVGLPYALVDAHVRVPRDTSRQAGRALAVLAVAAALAGVAAFLHAVPHPGSWAADKWRAAHHYAPAPASGSSHLADLGSNRFDFWRVARGELARHPLVGDGARGFGPAYLRDGRSAETPRRAHSLPMDVLAETGVVGFALLVLGLGAPLWIALRRSRRGDMLAVAAVGGCLVFLVQACVDWTWTFAPVTIPALVLLGVGAAVRDGTGAVPARPARALAGVAVALSVLVLAPPWLSTRYVNRGIADRSTSDLRLAHRLDPLSAEPLLAETWIVPIQQAVPQLEAAVRREPDVVATRQALGLAYLASGHRAAARVQLEAARRLYPRNRVLAELLRKTR
jgi:hypothetical protein